MLALLLIGSRMQSRRVFDQQLHDPFVRSRLIVVGIVACAVGLLLAIGALLLVFG